MTTSKKQLKEEWEAFKSGSVAEKRTPTGATKSFKDITLKRVYHVEGVRLVQTTFGPRVIVTIKTGDEHPEDRWCFPRLQMLFVDKEGELLKEGSRPTKIGFESVEPYNFFFSK